jgi:hypothetical protein
MKNTSSARRARRTATQWAKIVDEAESTSLSLPEFCNKNEVSLANLQQWRRRFKKEQARENVQTTFVPLRVKQRDEGADAANKTTGCIDIVLANGRMLRIAGAVDPSHLRTVIDAVDGDRPC